MKKREVVLILDNIRSLHNVGSIFRTADGVGVKKIYLLGITPEPVDLLGRVRGPIAKVALGAEGIVPWEKISSFSRLAKELRADGYGICALEQAKTSVDYRKLPRKIQKIALVLGNEVEGVSKAILRSSDFILEIPMVGEKESLNVSVSAGIALFRLVYP